MSYNRVIIKGFLGSDPEITYFESGGCEVKLSIATRKWSQRGGEETNWVPVRVRGKRAEPAGEYLKKGREVLVEGEFRTDTWEDKDGNRRTFSYVLAWDWDFCGKAAEGEDRGPVRGERDDDRGHGGGRSSHGGGRGRDDRDDDRGGRGRREAPYGGGRGSGGGQARGGQRPSKPANDYDFDDTIPF